jgi:hypothetical protein
LDLGAGALALAPHVTAAGGTCTAADLIARSAACHVIDLNQGQFPPGEYDCITLLDVLEFLHDVPAVLPAAGSRRRG